MKSSKPKKRNKKIFSQQLFIYFFLTCIEIAAMIIFFEFPRSLFYSSANSVDIVGYRQYFGYPMYFDTMYIFIFISLPFVNYLLLKKM